MIILQLIFFQNQRQKQLQQKQHLVLMQVFENKDASLKCNVIILFWVKRSILTNSNFLILGNVVKEFDVRATWLFDLGKGQMDGNEEFFYHIIHEATEDDTRAVIRRVDTFEPLPNGPEEFYPKTGKTLNGLDIRGPVYSAETYLGKVWWKIVKIDREWTITIQIIKGKSNYFLESEINACLKFYFMIHNS